MNEGKRGRERKKEGGGKPEVADFVRNYNLAKEREKKRDKRLPIRRCPEDIGAPTMIAAGSYEYANAYASFSPWEVHFVATRLSRRRPSIEHADR